MKPLDRRATLTLVGCFAVGRSLRRRAVRTAALGALLLAACKGGEIDGTITDAMSASAPASSKCGPTPAQLVDFNSLATEVGAHSIGAMQLAVDGANIYFVFGSALMRMPIRGGPVTSMLPLLPDVGQSCDPVATPTGVLLHHIGSDVTNDEQILSVPIEGGKSTILGTSSGFVRGLATDGHDAYFVDSAGLKLSLIHI